MEAYNNKYLHQQKMYACNAVKDICGWDSVALQWKQHLFKKLGEFMPVDEYRKVQEINYKVRKTFGRRFINEEELQPLKHGEQKSIGIITTVYNAENYIEKCIRSVAAQDYEQYHMYIVDDASTDNTVAVARETIASLPGNLSWRFTILENSENVGAVANHYNLLKNICTNDTYDISYDLYMILDGDDWLVNNPNIFHIYNNLYHDGAEFTYGSCWSLADNIPLVAQPYPPEVKAACDYRNYKFNWGMPYTHLRTFHSDLIRDLTENDLKISGKWPKAGGDNALFYYLIENANPDKVVCVSDIVYVYNDTNPLNDYKVNSHEQNKTAASIISSINLTVKDELHMQDKTILIAIPTNKNIEAATFKSIYDLEVPKGYKTHFQYFYGYQIDQIRNLIAEWGKAYDYLFCVDSDIVLPNDALIKMIEGDKDVISGLYVQRIPEKNTLEIYHEDEYGGTVNTPWANIKDHNGLHEIAACGFGCVLIKSEVLRTMQYPHFVYKSAINHADTLSEDVYFCQKAREHGFKIWCDTTILCDHVGSYTFKVDKTSLAVNEPTAEQTIVVQTHGDNFAKTKPKQAIVIRTSGDSLSDSYADLAEQSCRNVNLEVVRWNGFNKNQYDIKTLSKTLNINFGEMDVGAACATASHFGAWMHVASLETQEPIVILEHDALMLHNIPEMPTIALDSKIVALGYKITDPHKYDYKAAGGPTQVLPCKRHSGSHAYMITPNTARLLLQELKIKGAQRQIDEFYFMRTNEIDASESDIPLALMVPTPAIGWIRKSTIWDAPSTLNYDLHESFSRNHNQ
jgi:glycosyltransferase involved in cell wall biosynthesis